MNRRWDRSVGLAMKAMSPRANRGLGRNFASPSESTRTSRARRSEWSTVYRAPTEPPRMCPIITGRSWQQVSMRSSTQAKTRSASTSSGIGAEHPWPGKSGAMTRWVLASPSRTRTQRSLNSPGPWSRTIGGPSPAVT